MKKLLLIFSLFLPTMTLSTNTISCFGRHKNSISNDDKTIPSALDSDWYSNLHLKHISLINDDQQLVVSRISDAPYSDINLDFSSNWRINTNCSGTISSVIETLENKNYCYTLFLCDELVTSISIIAPLDENGNHIIPDADSAFKTLKDFDQLIESNNKIFEFDAINNVWIDLTDPYNIIPITKKDTATNQQYIWNSPNNILYLGTSTGLYTSSDDGTTWNFITGTESLNITSITGTSTTLFLSTDSNGLWSYVTSSSKLTQVTGTEGLKINPDSLFLSNDNKNLFYGIENKGLWELPSLNINDPKQLIGNNGFITSTTNVEEIEESKNNLLIIRTYTDLITYD